MVRGRGGQGLWSKEPGPVRPNPKSERSCRKLDDRLREVRDLRPQKVPGGTVQRLLRVKLSLLRLLRPVKESGVQSGVSHIYNFLFFVFFKLPSVSMDQVKQHLTMFLYLCSSGSIERGKIERLSKALCQLKNPLKDPRVRQVVSTGGMISNRDHVVMRAC